MLSSVEHQLISKYNVPGPRYTSYPTVPFWKHDQLTWTDWLATIQRTISTFDSPEISLYVHLPFCESLCTFCGCHKRITKNHAVELPYLTAVLAEWEQYKKHLPEDRIIRELHFGGGTPTFFEPQNLITLLEGIFGQTSVNPDKYQLGFEAHPGNTSAAHLQSLYNFGFRRLSLGIQSYNTEVQQAIHRIQTFGQVSQVHKTAREMGYTSISHDLVYGLPKQSLSSMLETVEKTLTLQPDRISLYSYAHVPWIKGNGQRGYSEKDLPDPASKRQLYETARELFLYDGYIEIGMDHFALPHDELAIALREQHLHRNFMGYTTQASPLLIGLGMSAISDSWFGFAQNEKTVEAYQARVASGGEAIFRGHLLSETELIIRQHILDLMCRFETQLHPDRTAMNEGILRRLEELVQDRLVEVNNARVRILERGMPFVRNCCMAFDLDLAATTLDKPVFSKTI